jgi:hypothetical protein
MFWSGFQIRVSRLSAPEIARIAVRSIALLAMALCLIGSSGCTAVPVAVGNPIPGMTVVAVAPFLNLSAEPTVDPRRFAIAYYTELQKTSNYEVIPLGVVELAIRENELDLSSPEDAVKLAQILHADAVVVGAVTEYVPYYPPQLGMKVNWYSPRDNWVFYPGITGGDGPPPDASILNGPCPNDIGPPEIKPDSPVVRGQSPDDDAGRFTPFPDPPPAKLAQAPRTGTTSASPAAPAVWPADPDPGLTNGSPNGNSPSRPGPPNRAFCDPAKPDGSQPVMSYTRFFDGADRQLIQSLKGYYYLKGDTRSGGWEAYLHRSDDFLRFASNLLVMEMLTLHGGPLKTEKVCLYGR